MTGGDAGRNVVLIGYRGSGKTTVGRLLATSLGWGFVDTDAMIVKCAGRTIAEIFRDEGEAAFRALEIEALAESLKANDQVISAGGGVIERDENMAALRQATVVWLDAPADVLWSRICGDDQSAASRPDLTTGGSSEVQAVLGRRRPRYAQAANIRIDACGSPREQVDAIVAALARRSGKKTD